MARTQSQNYAEIRAAILRRSAALFARKGFPNASIADLARANGMSRGLLYHYFVSKEALLDEILNRHLDMLLAEVQASVGKGSDPESRIRNAIRAIVRINADSQDLQIVLLHDLQNLKPAQRRAIVGKQRAILDVVSRLILACDAKGKVAGGRLKAQTMMLMGMVNYTYLWYDPKGPVGPEAYAEMVSDTYLAGLRAPASGERTDG